MKVAYQPQIVKQIDGTNPFVRAYFWLWPIDPARLNTCYVFWGSVLAPLNALLRLLVAPFYYAGRPLARRVEAWDRNRPAPIVNWAEESRKKERRQRRWARVLDAAAPAWHAIRWPLAGLGALGVAFGLGVVIWLAWNHPGAALQVLIVPGAVVLLVGVAVGIAYLYEETRLGRWLREFGRIIAIGYWSVKNRTCAKFEVVG